MNVEDYYKKIAGLKLDTTKVTMLTDQRLSRLLLKAIFGIKDKPRRGKDSSRND